MIAGQTNLFIRATGAGLPRPRRAAQRLRRLAEGADEGAAHPLRIAKAGGLRDVLDRLAGGLHAQPRHFDPQPLHRLRRRGAGLRDEGARKVPRTHAGLLGHVLDRQRRVEMFARPGQQRREAARRCLGLAKVWGCWKQVSGRKRKLRLGARRTSPLPQPKRTLLPSVKTSAFDPSRTWVSLVQQPVVLRIDCLVAFAGGFPQSSEIHNFDVSPVVLDDTGLLQRMCNGGDAVPLHTDHLSQEVLSKVQFNFTRQIVHAQ
jgi:hypothetical protein